MRLVIGLTDPIIFSLLSLRELFNLVTAWTQNCTSIHPMDRILDDSTDFLIATECLKATY
jgi:hypothetical protein